MHLNVEQLEKSRIAMPLPAGSTRLREKSTPRPHARRAQFAHALRLLATAAFPVVLVLAGCSTGITAASSSNSSFSISSAAGSIDTNCTGCNATTSGTAVEQFTATLTSGGAASVNWSVSGGDANSGAGTISASGQYTPPSYLTANSVQVTVTASLSSNTSVTASTALTVTPGFLQPLSPENFSVGSAGTVSITGYIAEAGGSTNLSFATASTANGSSPGLGTLGTPSCTHASAAFAHCTVTYTAPASVSSTGATYVVATIGTSASKLSSVILLNTIRVASNPATHQALQTAAPISLGTSGGNNNDYDTKGNQIQDCCGGTLGSLIQNSSGKQFLLSNNHVLARSDLAAVGDAIIQPGLIDNSCTPFGEGGGTEEVATLTGWLPLKSSATNADAAIAQVDSGAVSNTGAILELGAQLANGTLATAPPGISSTGGKGEAASLNMTVAKSGRTTGLTCANIAAVNLDVEISYYTNCAETAPYLTKTYTNQLGIEGNQFSDAGDSGSLVVDAANAEPVGLFFAGGLDTSGVSEGVANPAPDVISELNAQLGNGSTFTFVGTTDHPVSCLNYGDATVTAALARALTSDELGRVEEAMGHARALVNPAMGIVGVDAGKSSDHIGEGAIVVYVDPNSNASIPATIGGVRTVVIPATAQSVATGTAPASSMAAGRYPALEAAALNRAVATKQQIAQTLMRQNPPFFGIGVGQSLDNPKEPALVIYVDRNQIPSQLPPTIDGVRVRYVLMERLHVTRSYAAGAGLKAQSRCITQPLRGSTEKYSPDLVDFKKLRSVNLF